MLLPDSRTSLGQNVEATYLLFCKNNRSIDYNPPPLMNYTFIALPQKRVVDILIATYNAVQAMN